MGEDTAGVRDVDLDVDRLQGFIAAAVRLISNRQCTSVEANISESVSAKAYRAEWDDKGYGGVIRIDVKGLT